jgi:hypothetical protein
VWGLEEREVIGLLIIVLYLIAMVLLVDLWVRLRIVRSELENILRKIEEIERMNERREDP